MRHARFLLALTLATSLSLLGIGNVRAQSAQAAAITVSDAWIQAPPPRAPTAAGYLRLTNAGAVDDRLLSISSPRAARIEMHEMRMDGAMMTMRPLPHGVAIPAGGAFAFSPASAHIMFTGMARPFMAGEIIPLRLVFLHAGAIETAVRVRPLSGAGR